MLLNYVEDKESSEFYPTPKKIINKMLDKVDWRHVKAILEPSAGKGDILKEVAKYDRNNYVELDVDAIEIDGNLRSILKDNFSDKQKEELKSRFEVISKRGRRDFLTKKYEYYENGTWIVFDNDTQKVLTEMGDDINGFFSKGIHIVHNDFLTYTNYKTYDLIAMNPPFSNGDAHLLKALKLQKNGGQIVCLLNADTIKNPYTQQRKELVKLLTDYDADIEYIEHGFDDAERKTDVEVALIYVNIPVIDNDGNNSIFDNMAKAKNYDEPIYNENTEIEVADFVKAIVNRYQLEVESGIELINTYRRMKPYLNSSVAPKDYDHNLLILTNGENRYEITINDYVKSVRYKYWEGLLHNEKFVGKLTSKLQNFYQSKIRDYADYDFSEFNIYTLLTEMNASIKLGIEDEIMVMYDRLTEEHSYYPECTKNKHLYNGWKTNKAWKLGNKVILPCYNVFSSWDGRPRTYDAYNVIADIERVLNFFCGNMTEEISSAKSIERHFAAGITKNIPWKYGKLTFYKKGTCHITFDCPELIDRYNIYAAQNKGWLPPSYAKKNYSEMSNEEKEVIDSFQGEAAYNKVLNNQGYYLASPTNTTEMLMLTA